MKKTMPKPVNWQDFESLCKKLWGEIWECPSIKKNGRSGQAQHGVDIYGIPKGKANYFAIQCKGKDDYTCAALTEQEVDDEIKKALTFKPNLDCFIFATTANKDANIEEYIRIKNSENLAAGRFSIDLYSWEDIVDLIEEHKSTYDWYLKDVLHKENNNFLVEINGVSESIELAPVFYRNIIKVRKRSEPVIVHNGPERLRRSILGIANSFDIGIVEPNWNSIKVNRSLVHIDVCFFNTGDSAIEHYKVILEISNKICRFKESNFERIRVPIIPELYVPNDYYIDDETITYICPTDRPILVPQDGRRISAYLELPHDPLDFEINYRLLSRSFTSSGIIKVSSKPIFEDRRISREPYEGEQEHEYEDIVIKEEIVEEE